MLGALAFSPEQLELELQWIDEHVDGKPYGVDIVMPMKTADRDAGLHDEAELPTKLREMIPAEHWAFVDELLAEHGAATSRREPEGDGSAVSQGVLGWTEATGAPLTDIALAHPIALLASTRSGRRRPRSSTGPTARACRSRRWSAGCSRPSAASHQASTSSSPRATRPAATPARSRRWC